MAKKAVKNSRTLEEFRAKYDPAVKIPLKITQALASLEAEFGPEAHEEEGELCKRAGIGTNVIGKYRDKFAKHIVLVAREGRSSGARQMVIYFSNPKIAAKARGE